MATWPATLPALPRLGVQVSADDSVARSKMDAGPPSRRNRFTAITKSVSCEILIDGTQAATLDTFYHETLRNGALSFDWVDPRTDASVSMAFKQPPEFTGVAGHANPGNRWWNVALSLEIQP